MEQSFSAGVEFDGVKVRDPDQIRDGWANYFERLSTPSDKDFDTEWKDMVESNGRLPISRVAPLDQLLPLSLGSSG